MSDQDRQHLLHAIRIARRHMDLGHGGPFGAVIVREGAVLAEGWNEVTSTNDPTAHAEVVAIRRACRAAGGFSLAGATIYASCEPCPMCLGAVYWARLDRLVFAATRDEAAAIGFDDALIYDEIPKPIATRRLPTTRIALPESADLFAGWRLKADAVRY